MSYTDKKLGQLSYLFGKYILIYYRSRIFHRQQVDAQSLRYISEARLGLVFVRWMQQRYWLVAGWHTGMGAKAGKWCGWWKVF